jgi:hypothetical protein
MAITINPTASKQCLWCCCPCRLRWTVRGVPRVPWEAEGIFDGISEYKLDREGKIYEHKITNVQMRDPPLARSLTSIGLNMIPIPRLQGAPQVCLFLHFHPPLKLSLQLF